MNSYKEIKHYIKNNELDLENIINEYLLFLLNTSLNILSTISKAILSFIYFTTFLLDELDINMSFKFILFPILNLLFSLNKIGVLLLAIFV